MLAVGLVGGDRMGVDCSHGLVHTCDETHVPQLPPWFAVDGNTCSGDLAGGHDIAGSDLVIVGERSNWLRALVGGVECAGRKNNHHWALVDNLSPLGEGGTQRA